MGKVVKIIDGVCTRIYLTDDDKAIIVQKPLWEVCGKSPVGCKARLDQLGVQSIDQLKDR